MVNLRQERILVFNFGSQFVQLIARRVREQNVYCEIVRYDLSAARVKELAPKGIILSGGPKSVCELDAPKCDPDIFELGIPILGICYGMQLICDHFGGTVQSNLLGEFGRTELEMIDNNRTHTNLFENIDHKTIVWMSHADQVHEISNDFILLAKTPTCPTAAIQHKTRPIYAIQFHPEVSHTIAGPTILENFLKKSCGCNGAWKLTDFLELEIETIRKRVGNDRVICGLSGGVDSAVTAALLYRAIGNQLACIFVDNGLLRADERQYVDETFRNHFHVDLQVIDASDLFLERLTGIVDPQEKRKRIGHAFIDVFKTVANTISDAKFLAQGTLYPDVIESGGLVDGPSATIKTHHNVGGLPAELGFELIEPLRDLFKDEARRLGEVLGLPKQMVWRHPFPGPGLAVRCLGEVCKDRLMVLRQADTIYLEELEKAGLYDKIAQAFAVLLPVQTVGVMGDSRTYESVLALRAVTTDDFMTADWVRIDCELLARISTRIINEVRGVNRVVYDISTKPPATIEWE